MSLIDSKTNRIRNKFSVSELRQRANLMRGYNLSALNCAGSGHAGGTMSIMDIAAVLYLQVANHDPRNHTWDDRDRIVWSGGHKAPALYVSLGISGYFPIEEIATLRKYESPFQGHPHWLYLDGVEVSTGSLGQGLGIGVGMALRAKLDKKKNRIYVISGDGEWDEGSMWESSLEASHYKLDNLVVIIDRNMLQIDGPTEEVMKLRSIEKKLSSFGYITIRTDGHDIKKIITAFEKAKKSKGHPTAIIFDTTKGKGVSFMENKAGWHGKAPNDEELYKALKELKLDKVLDVKKLKDKSKKFQKEADEKIDRLVPKFKKDYFWNKQDAMKVIMEPTRFGFGRTLESRGDDKRIVCLGLDISSSVTISKFYEAFPGRHNRFLSMGIQEQSATTVAAGLAKEGKLPVLSTYGVFCSQRNADQMRTTVCYGNLNVFFAGAHGGISVGPDGATHQSLEEISVVGILPNMHLVIPCDVVETQKAAEYLLFKLNGPKYLRFAREATPIVTDTKTPFVFGKANVIRFRGKKQNFIDAFETVLAEKYKSEKETVAIIACGPEVPEAMRAAWILKEQFNMETRVLNVHTVKPLDKEAIIRAARDVDIVVTAEEHQKGGFGSLVASAIMEGNLPNTPKFAMIGVNDRFGISGQPWELIKAFGLAAEHIAAQVIHLKK
ncbi:transketolase [Candidatus Roizmanbacteria bacterium RIFCSPLOWO2_02_FULL_38_10]|uniref:Transketolase n=1 Tax=Candidatus Roizmanbacteria bacterium RIFCSPLOWO2_02_FULL_38_10 TaxID=1802074 RepID=A0A1F7JLY1_9BACT|nr:MAG: transketolase [Candidatus Roizmanbacteria bacterium RIFCSPLOWO2_02_FULL_38_10]